MPSAKGRKFLGYLPVRLERAWAHVCVRWAMSFSSEERRTGWLSELLERASEEVSKDRTTGVRTFLLQFRTNGITLA